MAREKNIQLLQFWQTDFYTSQKREIVKSIILSKCGLIADKINARECLKKEIPHKDLGEFCLQNHIQGAPSRNSKGIGLFHNGKLVAVIGYTEMKGTTTITRFCSIRQTVVRGAFSKLISGFEGTIVTHSSNTISDGGLYEKSGFVMTAENKADLWYTDYYRLLNRQGYVNYLASKEHQAFSVLEPTSPN